MVTFMYKLHKWCGLGLGVVLLLIAISGSILVFSENLRPLFEPPIDASYQSPISIDEQVRIANLQRDRLAMIQLPRESGEAISYLLDANVGFERFHLDPGTAELLAQTRDTQDVIEIIYYLHTHLLTGEPGHIVAGICALLSIGMLISGVVLWWPRGKMSFKSAFQVVSKPPIRFWRDVHKLAGIIFMAPLFIQFLTGAALVFFMQAIFIVSVISGSEYKHFDGQSNWRGEEYPNATLVGQGSGFVPTGHTNLY